jgi:hypothetical protein
MKPKMLTALFVTAALLGLAVKVAVAAMIMQAVEVSGDPVSNLIMLAGAAASVYTLGAVKRLDTRVTNSKAFRKLQPFLALGGAIGLPLLAGKIGVQIDPQALVNAPLATLVSIGAAELSTLVRRRTP